MPIWIENMGWISWNLLLAMTGPLFAWLFLRAKNPLIKVSLAGWWLLFVPNSLYLVTDLIHLPEGWNLAGPISKLILCGQYLGLVGLGIFLFGISIRLFLKGIEDFAPGLKRYRLPLVIGLNQLISFGLIMGRVMRTNSWYVFTHPHRVITDGFMVLQSPALMLWVLGFGILATMVWWLSERVTLKVQPR